MGGTAPVVRTPGRLTHTRGYDAVVVGSGYGGGVAACRLAQAGLRVLILEKGKAWDSSQFPTTFWQLLRNTHLSTPLGSVGNRNSLYQLYLQGPDSCCALAGCGLGGGSLVNAGLVVPVPKATLRHPDWPKQWCGKEWQASEARAMAMLEPQSMPSLFPKSQVMEAIASDIDIEGVVHRDAIRGGFRFQSGSGPNTACVTLDACVGCGNCVTGCPYNAKNSVDKNYLAVAIQAGAEVQTEFEVLYVTPNHSARQTARHACAAGHGACPCTAGGGLGNGNAPPSKLPTRRWRVHLSEVDYVESDYVIFAAGTLGTSEILLRSKDKGLGLSDQLGMGFSCNGSHVGIVEGAKAPTMGRALHKREFPNIPMASRTGPSISASHSSPSLQIVVQAAAIPNAYPEILFKTIFSYEVSLPGGLQGQLRALWRELKLAVCRGNKHAIILNIMGSDSGNGRIELDSESGRLTLCPPDDPSLSNKIKTCQRLTKRLGGVLCMSRFRSTSVHLLGGCNAGQDASCAVTNYKGQVFAPHHTSSKERVHSGLYVCDGSIIPCSVGINPTGTITTAAELVASHMVQDAVGHCCTAEATLQWRMQQEVATLSGQMSVSHDLPTLSREGDMGSFVKRPNELDLAVDGGVKGVNEPAVGPNAAVTDKFPSVEGLGEQTEELSSLLPPSVSDPDQVVVRETVEGTLGGLPCTLLLVMHMGGCGKHSSLLRGRVAGRLVMKYVEQRALHIVDGFVDMCWVDARSPFTQHMHYHLLLTSSTGARFAMDARKTMNPFLFAARGWQESTTLHTTLRQLTPPHHHSTPSVTAEHQDSGRMCESDSKMVFLEGQLHVSWLALLKSTVSLRGRRRFQFLGSLLKSLVQTYIWQIPRVPSVCLSSTSAPSRVQRQDYPACKHHNLTTRDGRAISMKQWPREGEVGVVLMLNGYTTESFCLPTEPYDLVRTVHMERYEPWVLQSRLHPKHSCTSFTIDDLAKYDLPAAFARIGEVKGTSCRVHVVAHCVGGLSMHMALLGNYVPASSVASLACTNSAMFINLTASARAKLILPLIPISMRILGSKTVLAMTRDDNRRHNLLRYIASILPRQECCSCNECVILSGIFGSTFWHSNVTARMHDWQHKEAAPCLPMAGFPHLRHICLAERVVDADGRDTYLVHPERLAVPTTYISGGRPILVTAETSSRAHLFMRHHHPQFRHERVQVRNYGHSDLLIGEHAHLDVFPHILHHLRRCSTTQPPQEESGEGVTRRQLATWEHLPPATPSLLQPIIVLLLALLLWFLVRWPPNSWLAAL